MFVRNAEAKVFDMTDGIKSCILAHSDGLMVVENHFKKGAEAPEHTHMHQQVGYIVQGKFEFAVDGEVMILNKGDSFYVEANAPHGCVAIEDGIVVDVFNPQREDFLSKFE